MTIDAFGRVVVSGPGYVRILIDANHDGVAESYKQFADGPATGRKACSFSDATCSAPGTRACSAFATRIKMTAPTDPPRSSCG